MGYSINAWLLWQDLHSVDLEEFKYGGTNITALRLVDPDKPELQRVVRDWAGQSRKPDTTHHLAVSTCTLLLH